MALTRGQAPEAYLCRRAIVGIVGGVRRAGVVAVGPRPPPTPLLLARAGRIVDAPSTPRRPRPLTEVAVAPTTAGSGSPAGLRQDGSASDDVFVFDPAAGTWTTGPTLPASRPPLGARVDAGRACVLVGGYVGDALNRGDRCGPPARRRRVGVGRRSYHCPTRAPPVRAAFDGSRIVYAGGVGPGGVASEVFALDRRRVGDGSGACRRAREHLAATSDGAGRTFVLGGRVGGLDGNLAIVDLVEGERGQDARRAADAARRRRRRSGGRRSARAWPAASRPAAPTRRSSAWHRDGATRATPGP